MSDIPVSNVQIGPLAHGEERPPLIWLGQRGPGQQSSRAAQRPPVQRWSNDAASIWLGQEPQLLNLWRPVPLGAVIRSEVTISRDRPLLPQREIQQDELLVVPHHVVWLHIQVHHASNVVQKLDRAIDVSHNVRNPLMDKPMGAQLIQEVPPWNQRQRHPQERRR